MAKDVGEPAEVQPPKRRPGRPRLVEPSPEYVTRRADIIATAAEVFREKGYDAGTLDDVAHALDLRRASLYYYVKSKANLLYMIFEHAIDLYYVEFHNILDIQDPAKRLESLIRWHIANAVKERALMAVVFDYRHRLEAQYQEAIREREEGLLTGFRQTVEDACAAGVVHAENSAYAALAIFGMSSWTYKWFQEGRDDSEVFADTCVSLILRKPARRPTTGRRPKKTVGSRK